MKCVVTGGAGFIGSHMVDRLIKGNEIVVIDNLSEGNEDNISEHMGKDNLTFVKTDLCDTASYRNLMKGVDVVFHLAAHRDVRRGVERPDIDVENGMIATFNLLEAMRANDVGKIVFSSSQVVYGEPSVFPVDESYGPLLPISIYAASKLSCESLIMAYSHTFDIQSWIFRFANVVGPRGTHGVIPDFIGKLKKDRTTLEILGDGKQIKPYLSVEDCVDAIMYTLEHANEEVNLYNLGTEDWTSVTTIAQMVTEACGLDGVEFRYTGGRRGWVGDVPKIKLSIDKIKGLGWTPKHNSDEAVKLAIDSLVELLWSG